MAGSWSNTASNLIILVEQISGYSGLFAYSPAPGAGTLVLSIAAAAGTDPYGNAYDAGLALYSTEGLINFVNSGGDVLSTWTDTVNGSQIQIEVGGGAAGQSFTPPTAGGADWQSADLSASVSNVFGANTALFTISGAYNKAHVARPTISMFGSSDTATQNRIDLTAQQVNVSGDLTAANLQYDTELLNSGGAVTSFTLAVTFPEAYPIGTIPAVTTNIDSGAGTIARWGSRAISVSETGFTLFVFRGDSGDPAATLTNLPVQWLAYG